MSFPPFQNQAIVCTFFIDKKVVNEVIQIRKSAKIKLPDAIIIASAIVKDCRLVTRNTSDFTTVDKEVEIINPF